MKAQNLERNLRLLAFTILIFVLLLFFFDQGDLVRPLHRRSKITQLVVTQSGAISKQRTTNVPLDATVEFLSQKHSELSGYQRESKKPPLVFQPIVFLIDAIEADEFSSEEDVIIYEVQNHFATQMANCPNQGLDSLEYRRCWSKAQRASDHLLLVKLGVDKFNHFNSLAAGQIEKARLADQR